MDQIEINPVTILTNQLTGIAKGTIAVLPQLFVAFVVLVATWLLAKLVKALVGRALGRSSMRQSLRDLLKMLSGLGVWVLGLMSAAIVLFPNLTPASMLAGLGIGSVAIGFAFKDTFENFLAGIIILLRREMRIGDYIDCEDLEGRVESIAIRETHIRQADGQLVIVPNSILFKNPLTIRTDQDQRRTTIICGIAYDEDVAQGREVIYKAVEGCKTVIQDNHPVQIFAQEFADSSINFEITWWTGSKPVDIRTSRDEVVEAVKTALDNAGIEIPFPYRTMTFKEPLSIRRGDAAA
ncbi:MAG: mechanosensitive ion channel family protein [Pseudomonadota bacterium]